MLEGEGIGPEMVDCALRVLEALESVTGLAFDRVYAGAIGTGAVRQHCTLRPAEILESCAAVFEEGAPVLAGPVGGRTVYDLRARFGLFCKLVPLRPSPALARANRLREGHVTGLDILVVRENAGGVYQGTWHAGRNAAGLDYAEHAFGYDEPAVRRILEVAARASRQRRGSMAVVLKDGGVPAISDLWRRCGVEVADAAGIEVKFLNVDLAAYQLVQEPRRFDVIACPNLFGDILADLGAILLGSRGLSFSGNFSASGRAIYQTNHGAGHDLVGQGVANPAGQILSLAMLLRESFGLGHEASLIEDAVEHVWRAGWRTFDLPEEDCRIIGTRELADRVAEAVKRLASVGVA
ncbi:MAG: isocitrate/isopropylmalate family dehydrogenase [Burkholderiales bacterium]|nr:isocitrate/isopropylmalate family dehydrogenase [Burkholderiales bacterium]